ncbi:uncharacterized protein [Cicer arietinum]|uniref:Uncharacterized protein LOC101504818 n=1 Tax=Cicer arietinum TaxID=3827 RepID=A0A1S2Y9T9_CICAR|nr:uncharacterized protein LOC101504818 [Cicer arietinum]
MYVEENIGACFVISQESTIERHKKALKESKTLPLLFLFQICFIMAISDTVVSNLTTIYVAVITCMKAYGFLCGRSFNGAYVVMISTTVVALILMTTLTWDLSRKATYAFNRDHPHNHVMMCKGGICWHGVAVRSPASELRFRLPHQQNAAF